MKNAITKHQGTYPFHPGNTDMTRTKKETSEVIARTIKSIRSHATITDALIKRECLSNNISEKTIRTITQGCKGTKIVPFKNNNNDE